ncbi:MAG: undecaprenyl-diphosphate phosphatase, partial [Spirochaetales bacterium]|nr:undecaprenyl-diphosphate phosphatase [Spirochaetales bacterium]
MMTILQSIFLGALQGIAEFLPVSSSGHLVVFRNFMNLGDVPILFDVLLHCATLLVVLIVFRKIIFELIKSIWRFIIRKTDQSDSVNLRVVAVILIASVFTAVLGFGIEALDVAHKPRLVSVLFLVTAGVLLFTRFIKTEETGYQKAGFRTALITGLAQGIAVFPGISRSGMTISASLFTGIGKEKAGEYSFLLSIPAIAGAIILEIRDLDLLSGSVSPDVMIAGMVAAFVVGLASILFLLRLIKRSRLYLFSFYLIPFGI